MRPQTRSVLLTVGPASALEQHADIVVDHGGVVAGVRPDGLTATFPSAAAAVEAAIALQQSMSDVATTGGGRAALRVGVHVGDLVPGQLEENGGLGGRPFAVARALCDLAADRSIVMSGTVRELLGPETEFEVAPLDPEAAVGDSASDAWQVAWAPKPQRRSITVVIAEDVAIVRAGVVALLRDEGFDVVGEAADRDGLLAVARAHRPQLVITDVRMPPTQTDEGIVAAATLRNEQPDIAVLVLSQYVEPEAAAMLLANNPTAVGYLLKERVSDLDEFIDACRVVADGGVVIDPLVTDRLLQSQDRALGRLTGREREVLELMAQGRSNAAITKAIHLSPKTLESHIRSIFTKLDLPEDPDDHRRVAAVVRYLHHRP